MALLNSILKTFLKRRISHIEYFMKHPHEVQHQMLLNHVHKAKDTEWGKKHGYGSIKSWEDYKNRVPVTPYEDLFPYIERILKGESNILWPEKIEWFSKSSGTTNAKSKF